MKRIIVICEGETEQEFVQKTLSKYFISKQIVLQAPLIKASKGGIVRWDILKKQIENHLKQEKDVFVTTFIDYYGIYSKYEFPKWEESRKYNDKNERLTYLENEMKAVIASDLQHRFIPYMQLHEFEGLLFCNKNAFLQQIPSGDIVDREELDAIFDKFPNPELINETKETSPSHRLKKIIKGYNKVVYGNIIAEAIGLYTIRNKAPRFNNWIDRLSDI